MPRKTEARRAVEARRRRGFNEAAARCHGKRWQVPVTDPPTDPLQ